MIQAASFDCIFNYYLHRTIFSDSINSIPNSEVIPYVTLPDRHYCYSVVNLKLLLTHSISHLDRDRFKHILRVCLIERPELTHIRGNRLHHRKQPFDLSGVCAVLIKLEEEAFEVRKKVTIQRGVDWLHNRDQGES